MTVTISDTGLEPGGTNITSIPMVTKFASRCSIHVSQDKVYVIYNIGDIFFQ